MAARHPYHPPELVLSGHTFTKNDLSVATLITIFASGVAVVLSLVLFFVRRVKPKLSGTDIGLILWFVMCESLPKPENKLTGYSGHNTLVLRKLLCV
jgi:hypothetical protein